MSTLVRNHLDIAFLFLRILFARSSAFSMPRPTPENEWIVTPPMLHAAMPVVAIVGVALIRDQADVGIYAHY